MFLAFADPRTKTKIEDSKKILKHSYTILFVTQFSYVIISHYQPKLAISLSKKIICKIKKNTRKKT